MHQTKKYSLAEKISLYTIVAVILSSVGGELVRLPFGPGLGTLPSDLFLVVGVLLVFGLTGWNFFKTNRTGNILLLFLIVAFLSWLNGTQNLSDAESLESFLYFGRFTLYALLFFLAHQVDVKNAEKIPLTMLGAAVVLAILGFLQLYFFPSFLELEMQKYGWDPHENRLLSTWFDPNFIGGLFAFVIGLNCEIALYDKNKKIRLLTGGGITIILIALLLTYSRSAYLAFGLIVGIFGFLRSRKLLVALCIAALLFTSVSSRAQERIAGIFQSIRSLTQEQSGELPDATARLRLQSWEQTWTIFSENPVLGVGFNAFKFAQLNKGYLEEENAHAGSGSDASLLTILATTGIVGFSIFCWLFGAILWDAWQKKNMGLFAAFCGILVHSLFVNSLLLPFIMIYIWTSAGLKR